MLCVRQFTVYLQIVACIKRSCALLCTLVCEENLDNQEKWCTKDYQLGIRQAHLNNIICTSLSFALSTFCTVGLFSWDSISAA